MNEPQIIFESKHGTVSPQISGEPGEYIIQSSDHAGLFGFDAN